MYRKGAGKLRYGDNKMNETDMPRQDKKHSSFFFKFKVRGSQGDLGVISKYLRSLSIGDYLNGKDTRPEDNLNWASFAMPCSVFYHNLSQYGSYMAVMQVSGISLSVRVSYWSYCASDVYILPLYFSGAILLHHLLLNKNSPPTFIVQSL